MSSAAVVAGPAPEVRRAVGAVYAAFIGSGFAFASWAARIPQVRDALHVTPGTLGVVLLCVALGSIVSMPTSGLVISRVGEARTVAVMALVLAVGLATVAVGYHAGIPPVAVGLFLLGLGNGSWDVGMNVHGAAVERRLGRSVMSRFHAGFSIGTVAGAGVGAALIALHVGITAHLLGVALVTAAVVPVCVLRGFLPHVEQPHEHSSRRAVLAAWREARTLVIGLFVLCLAFTEGTGNDWLSLAVIDGYHVADSTGTLTLALFLTAMTVGRWFGPALLDRYGRVAVLRATATVALVGLLGVVFGHVYGVAVAGTVLWGLGTSLGFPTGMSAAADDPRRAAARVSVVASIAYVAFLGGPPLIGFVGDHLGVLRALTVAAGLIAVALLACGALAPRPPAPDGAASEPVAPDDVVPHQPDPGTVARG